MFQGSPLRQVQSVHTVVVSTVDVRIVVRGHLSQCTVNLTDCRSELSCSHSAALHQTRARTIRYGREWLARGPTSA